MNTAKIEFENLFVEYLTRLEPKKEYVELFEAIVLDNWKEKQAQALTSAKKLQQKVEELKIRREKLIDAFVYKELIDKTKNTEKKEKPAKGVDSDILVDQIRAVDNRRFKKHIGKMTAHQRNKLLENLKILILE